MSAIAETRGGSRRFQPYIHDGRTEVNSPEIGSGPLSMNPRSVAGQVVKQVAQLAAKCTDFTTHYRSRAISITTEDGARSGVTVRRCRQR